MAAFAALFESQSQASTQVILRIEGDGGEGGEGGGSASRHQFQLQTETPPS